MSLGVLYLSASILLEVGGTISMKLAEGFTRLGPSLCIFVFYGAAFTAFTLALRTLDLSMAYALWAGVGTALVSLIGAFYFHEAFPAMKIIAMVFIIFGTVLLRV